MSNTTEADGLSDWLAAYRYAKQQAAQWGEAADECKAKLTAHLDEHNAEVGTVAGEPAFKWVPVTSSRFDSKAFRHDHPELAAGYMTEQRTHRFTVVESS